MKDLTDLPALSRCGVTRTATDRVTVVGPMSMWGPACEELVSQGFRVTRSGPYTAPESDPATGGSRFICHAERGVDDPPGKGKAAGARHRRVSRTDRRAIFETLRELAVYYEATRQVGHTRAIKAGLDRYEGGVALLVSNRDHGRAVTDRPDVTLVPVGADPAVLRTLRLPLLIDNETAWSLFRDAADAIGSLAAENDELRGKLKAETESDHETTNRKGNTP